MTDDELEALVAKRLGGGHERVVTRPQRHLEQQPACASEALGNEIKFLTAHPGGVTRGDLAARQHLECDPLRSE